jgi:hypothetical protein
MGEGEIVGVPSHAQNLSDHDAPADISGTENCGAGRFDLVMPEEKQREAVLRTFFGPDGRLVSMPARMGKRRFVLEQIAYAFEPGVRYSELEVNAILRSFYEDYVTLRRYLVDASLLGRDHGVYWRTGGYVET